MRVHLQAHAWHSKCLRGHRGKGKGRRQRWPLSILVENAVPMFLKYFFILTGLNEASMMNHRVPVNNTYLIYLVPAYQCPVVLTVGA